MFTNKRVIYDVSDRIRRAKRAIHLKPAYTKITIY